jgi:hypothetical protein
MGRGACLTWGAIAFVSLLISHAAPVDVSFELRGLTRTLTAMLSAIVAEEHGRAQKSMSVFLTVAYLKALARVNTPPLGGHDSRLEVGGEVPRVHGMDDIVVCCSTAGQEIDAYSGRILAAREHLDR